jgi:hypothetical protein
MSSIPKVRLKLAAADGKAAAPKPKQRAAPAPRADETVVWATLRGYPPWPAIGRPAEDGQLDCEFFAWRNSHAVLPADKCPTFESRIELCGVKPKKASQHKSYATAVREARAWLEKHQVRRSSRAPVQRDLAAEVAFLPDGEPSPEVSKPKQKPKPKSESKRNLHPWASRTDLPPLRNLSPTDITKHGFVECKGARRPERERGPQRTSLFRDGWEEATEATWSGEPGFR